MECLVEECEEFAYSRNLCHPHYNKNYRAGTLEEFPRFPLGKPRQPTKINRLNHLEIGWVAGIIEGEGNFHAHDSTFQIRVGMTDKDIIDRLIETTGIGTYTLTDRSHLGYKNCHTWTVSAINDVIHLLVSIVPLLGDRKRGEVMKMLNTRRI